MTHADLVARGARWLQGNRHRCTIVLAEMRTNRTSEQPDVIGWYGNVWSILLECKASRADFMRDHHKPHRRVGRGMGQERWYFARAGVIRPLDVPDGWGLAEVDGRRVVITIPAPGTRTAANMREWGAVNAEVCARELPFLLGAVAKVRNHDVPGLLAALSGAPEPDPAPATGA